VSKLTNRAPNRLTSKDPVPKERAEFRAVAHTHIGPLPPASEFANYDSALPGAADRILTMAEQASAHIRESETAMIKGAIKSDARGQYFGFITTLLSLGIFTFLVYTEKPLWSVVPASFALGNLVAILIGQWRRKQ